MMEFAGAAGAVKVKGFGPVNGPSSVKVIQDFARRTAKKTVSKAPSDLPGFGPHWDA